MQPHPSSLFSLPLLCLGLGLIAVCVLIPQADSNRRLRADRDQLQHDLTQVESQVGANQEFLGDVETDPGLLERLAQRQMRQIRVGTSVLDLPAADQTTSASPFQMITVPEGPAVAPYQPMHGFLGAICQNAHQQLYAIGAGMLMVAASLVMGGASNQRMTNQ